MGMLKKATSGVLAILSCSRTESTLRASKSLRPCWTTFLTIPVKLLALNFSRAYAGFLVRNIQQGLQGKVLFLDE
jgi:hypothetical protein